MKRYASLFERLLANSVKLDDQNDNGCWVWIGKNCRGYGRLNVRLPGGKHATLAAHRAMFEEMHRPLELDETVDHLCRVTLCINPDHLEALPNAENARRSQVDNPRRPPPR